MLSKRFQIDNANNFDNRFREAKSQKLKAKSKFYSLIKKEIVPPCDD